MFERCFSKKLCSTIMPERYCSACRFTGSCLDFRCLVRAGRFLLFIPLIFGTFHQGKVQKGIFLCFCRFKSTKKPYVNEASPCSEKPTQIHRTVALVGRDDLLSEASFYDLLLFFHLLPTLLLIHAGPRARPGYKGRCFLFLVCQKVTSMI